MRERRGQEDLGAGILIGIEGEALGRIRNNLWRRWLPGIANYGGARVGLSALGDRGGNISGNELPTSAALQGAAGCRRCA